MSFSFTMGNQRQVLKDNIEKELVAKIETAKDVLTQLNKNLEISKHNSFSAKEEIRTTADAMKDILLQRKKELIKEVDNLHSVQARSLQDAMRSTCITMGRLQNMLTNLDSFDQSQLVELQIPQVNMGYAAGEPSQISVSLECDQLQEDLNDWGNVTTDGFQCCMLEEPPMSAPPMSSYARTRPPVHEATKILASCANKENQKEPPKITAVCESCPWSSWGLENWLSGATSRKFSVDSTNKDDFLIVPSPCSESSDMDFVLTSPEIDNAFNQIAKVEFEDGESGSSIVCVEKDTESVHSADLSAWLKPRKSVKLASLPTPKNISTPTPTIKYNEVILSSDASSFLAAKKRSVNPSEKRTLDFPCLKMETENWVHKKKAKSTSCSFDKAHSFDLNGQKLIPPGYALPNPFWLKKYQHKR